MELKKLKNIRDIKHVNQEEIAVLLGISKSTYSRKENGKIVFKLEEVKLLKEYLKLSEKEIFEIFL
ncbi:MAG: helix-turn-helix transcriptional regulator [Sarcina sp.]